MKRAYTLVLLAGGFGVPAVAQSVFPANEPMEFGVLDPVGYPSRGGYESRALGYVYDNVNLTFGQSPARWSSVANHRHCLEDIAFAPGPWATVTGRIMEQMTWGVRRAAGGPYDCDVRFLFWDQDDATYAGFGGTGTSMIDLSATPLADITLQIRAAGTPTSGASGTQYTSSLAGLPGGGVAIPDDDDGFYLEIQILEAGTTNFLANDNFRVAIATSSTAPAGGNPASVGFTSVDLGYDIIPTGNTVPDGIFLGEPAFSGTTERRSYVLTNATPSRATGCMVRFRGDIPPPPPPPATDLGCLPDGITTANATLADASVAWYLICVPLGIQDLSLQFLDVDTEGSLVDTSIALYNSDGGLITVDHNGGSSENAQLSYGVGRRAASGDGMQYDGRNGQLVPGNYYIAVAPTGSSFADAFTVTPAGLGGDVTLSFNTNQNGTPLAPSVTPIINHLNYATVDPSGPIGFPDMRGGLAMVTGLRGVLWSTFETTAEAGSSTAYLDLDFGRLCSVGSDPVAYLFDSAGNMVAFSDDEGPGEFPLLSFGVGDGVPRFYGNGVEVFTGQNGNLPAGVYYIALGLFATQDITLLGGDDRWHVRGTSGSSWNVGADILTGGVPGGPTCDPDVNCDGVPDQDDVACIILAVAGDLNCFCQADPDFNGDGVPDQDDVAAVILTVAGAPCP